LEAGGSRRIARVAALVLHELIDSVLKRHDSCTRLMQVNLKPFRSLIREQIRTSGRI
jgi:hypothetical protein